MPAPHPRYCHPRTVAVNKGANAAMGLAIAIACAPMLLAVLALCGNAWAAGAGALVFGTLKVAGALMLPAGTLAAITHNNAY